MIAPLSIVAIVSVLVAFGAAVAMGFRWRNQHFTAFRPIVLYTLGCSTAFLQVPWMFAWISGRHEVLPRLNEHPDLAVAVFAGSAIAELGALAVAPGLFYQIFFAAALHAIGSLVALPLAGYGIINLVWFTVFTGALAGFMIAKAIFIDLEHVVADSDSTVDAGLRRDMFDVMRREMNQMLKIGLQTFLALGASLGVSMSILLGGGKASWDRADFQLNAAKLVAGFFLIGLGLAFWVVKPYLASFTKVREYFRTSRVRSWLMTSQ